MKIIAIFILVFIILQSLLGTDYSTERSKIYIGPSKNIKSFTFGYDDFLASMIWVRLVQDFHVCDQNDRQVKYPKFQDEKDPLGEILNRELPPSRCKDGWVYQMLDVITDLQPEFRSAYVDGGTMLSVLVDDRLGAQKIFHKGLDKFPADWELLYRTAYHEMFEMQDAETSQGLMLKAAQRGAPQWVYSLAAQLFSRNGKAAFALSILDSVLDRDLGGEFTDRIKRRMEIIKNSMEKDSGQKAQ